MQIFYCDFLTGRQSITLEVEPSDFVIEVKDKIEEKLKIPGPKRLHSLYYESRPLDDDKTLSFYNLSNNSSLKLVVRLFARSTNRPSRERKEDTGDNSTGLTCKAIQDLIYEENDKKMRVVVFAALRQEGISEKDEIFETCQRKLFNICKIEVFDAMFERDDSYADRMENMVKIKVKNVIKMEKLNLNQNQIIRNIHREEISKNEACKKFQDKLSQSRTDEVSKEVEDKTITFKKLEEQKIEITKQISELETKQYINTDKFEDRKRQAQQEKWIMVQDIKMEKITLQENQDYFEKAKIKLQKSKDNLANKEKIIENMAAKQLIDIQQTDFENNKIKKEIGSLKKIKMEIEKEQDDLPKKQKVNEGLLEHITNMIDDKKKDLECPVCFETAENPIYQCTGSHLICKECLPNLNICPECRTQYPARPFRNRFAEKMEEEIKKLSAERRSLLDGI